MGKSTCLGALIVLGGFCLTGSVNAGEMYFTPAVAYTDEDEAPTTILVAVSLLWAGS